MNRLLSPSGAAAIYTVAAVALTWPLATAPGSALPWDLGDPVLNTWILAWGASHLQRFFGGDPGALAGYWDANIFHPSPLALAYSEHLFAQAAQIWPVYALTGNPLLCHNLVFLSTFVLSGLGMFLLVRDVTGSRTAALTAGLIFAFTPYRIAQSSHLQVLSSQWMPFVFYALRRYFAGGGMRPLAGAAAALIAQNLSCGYYLVFFAPAAGAYALFEILRRGLWRNGRVLVHMGAFGLVVSAATWPFVEPYLALRAMEFPARGLNELHAFSADLRGYLAADPRLWLWGGRLEGFSRTQEGRVFQGFVPVALAALAAAALLFRDRTPRPGRGAAAGWRRWAAAVAGLFAALNLAAAAVVAAVGSVVERVGPLTIRMTRPGAALLRAAAGAALLAWLSPGFRRRLSAAARTDTAFYLILTLAAVVLSFGPTLSSGGRITVAEAPYGWLYHHVPGFDGVRAPARFAMLAAFGLSVLAGIALGELRLRRPGWGAPAAGICAALFLVEAGAAPIVLDGPLPSRVPGVRAPDGPLQTGAAIPDVYRAVAELPPEAVLVEFPTGSMPWDVRYMFYSTFHWRRLVNGFSGGEPARYAADLAALRLMGDDPRRAWSRLIQTGASHAIVHLAAYDGGGGLDVVDWLTRHGAREVGRFGADRLLALPGGADASVPGGDSVQ